MNENWEKREENRTDAAGEVPEDSLAQKAEPARREEDAIGQDTPPEMPRDTRPPMPENQGKVALLRARRKKQDGAGKAIGISLISLSLATIVLLAILLGLIVSVAFSVRGLLRPASARTHPPEGTFSVISVKGDIFEQGTDALGVNDPSYHHKSTISYIEKLAENENDRGILLYLDTPGGGVYESDELYRALAHYHEETGRPIWAYMARTCASGGYYVSMAAQKLYANYNTTTGSIGVYIALTDVSGLYGKLGVETVLVRSGDNKGVGVPGVEITDAQREVYQSSVDESYERFIDLIEQGRGMEREEAYRLSDGRTYTANQALQQGLVDEVTDWEQALSDFEKETEAEAFYPSFSRQSSLGRILSGVLGNLPQGETEAVLSRVEALPQGVPLAYAPELAGAY
ncbi:signal peptide peptidase SppA [Ruminococcaceae bacterium OttesenSCG-928-I18]|nr:signal peptide peptidase SppA [Ruminococcaceae bacterium OttesenSCG-928-I18]